MQDENANESVFFDPDNPASNHVRINENKSKCGPAGDHHVHVRCDGHTLDSHGNDITGLPRDDPARIIPYAVWKTWRTWNSPT